MRSSVNEGEVVGLMSPEAGMFLGIPFTVPPLGELRWTRPQDPVPYASKYWDATYLRPGCDQICDQPAAEYSCPAEVLVTSYYQLTAQQKFFILNQFLLR